MARPLRVVTRRSEAGNASYGIDIVSHRGRPRSYSSIRWSRLDFPPRVGDLPSARRQNRQIGERIDDMVHRRQIPPGRAMKLYAPVGCLVGVDG
jgi:hypothetical protein